MRNAQVPLLIASLVVGLSMFGPVPPAEAEKLRAELDEVVSGVTVDAEGRPYRNAVVLLESPSHSLVYRGAAGVASLDDGAPMSPDHQFYVESITKSFTATIVLQLAEEGRLGERGLDSTLAELQVFPPEVLNELHRIGDATYGPGITVRQLVQHRTGMKNFTYEDENGPASEGSGLPFAPNSFLGALVFDPSRGLAGLRRCTQDHLPDGTDVVASIAANGFPDECDPGSYYFFRPPFEHWDHGAWKADREDRFAGLLNFYLSGMNATASFPPGEDFKYTDTNYLVLGLLIEKVTGNSLHAELRRRIFDPLGMDRSYMSYATDPAAGKWRRALSELWALDGLPIVKLGINRSMMWSDAGIVSTVDDLNRFVRALVGGKLFKHDATRATREPRAPGQPHVPEEAVGGFRREVRGAPATRSTPFPGARRNRAGPGLRRGRQILLKDARVSGGDAQERQGGSLRVPSALFPVPQRAPDQSLRASARFYSRNSRLCHTRMITTASRWIRYRST